MAHLIRNLQPRPCERCRKFNLSCIFNPLSRSYCDPCKEKKVRCSNAFKIITDHCMATYLGYASCIGALCAGSL